MPRHSRGPANRESRALVIVDRERLGGHAPSPAAGVRTDGRQAILRRQMMQCWQREAQRDGTIDRCRKMQRIDHVR